MTNFLNEPAGVEPERCITCSDEGVVVTVVDLADDATAIVETDAGREEVDISIVSPVEIGTRLLVHASVALAIIKE